MSKAKLKANIQKAIKKGDISYLRGVLQVMQKHGTMKQIKWLNEEIDKLKNKGEINVKAK